MILPADAPYDHQVLLQSIRRAVSSWGAARVEIEGRVLLVSRSDEPFSCRTCGRLAALACRRDGVRVCALCGLASAGLADSGWVAVGPLPHSPPHGRRVAAARHPAAPHRQ